MVRMGCLIAFTAAGRFYHQAPSLKHWCSGYESQTTTRNAVVEPRRCPWSRWLPAMDAFDYLALNCEGLAALP